MNAIGTFYEKPVCTGGKLRLNLLSSKLRYAGQLGNRLAIKDKLNRIIMSDNQSYILVLFRVDGGRRLGYCINCPAHDSRRIAERLGIFSIKINKSPS